MFLIINVTIFNNILDSFFTFKKIYISDTNYDLCVELGYFYEHSNNRYTKTSRD